MAENNDKEWEEAECSRCGGDQFTLEAAFVDGKGCGVRTTCTHCHLVSEINFG